MHGLIEIHTGSTTIGNIYNWRKFDYQTHVTKTAGIIPSQYIESYQKISE